MRFILLIASVVFLQACVSSKFVSSKVLEQELNLKGKSVVTYNTLDIRTSELGEAMLESLNSQLQQRFSQKNVKADVLNFKSSKIGTSYMVAGSGIVPMEEFVAQYKEKEAEDNVDYRLLILPSQMTVSGAWRFFDITWILVDVRTERTVWQGVSKGEHLVQWSINEMPEKRAALIVDSLFAELEKAKVI